LDGVAVVLEVEVGEEEVDGRMGCEAAVEGVGWEALAGAAAAVVRCLGAIVVG